MSDRIPAHAIDGLTTSGSGAVSATAVAVTPPSGLTGTNMQTLIDQLAAAVLVPLTTSVGGVPELVWDDDDQLVMTEVPR